MSPQNRLHFLQALPPLRACIGAMIRRFAAPARLCAALLLAAAAEAATINVWYGDHQVFGRLGVPQKWVNILGNVTDSASVTSLTYSLNGAAPKNLSIGPDTRRLQNAGDFNADIPIDDLVDGANTVVITAVAGGITTTKSLTVEFHPNRVWPLPYSTSWSQVSAIQDAVQVVDGRWTFSASGARTAAWGYDRVLAVGDILWTDYEVTVPITIHAVDTSSTAYNSVSIAPGLGIVLRWYGHEDWGTALKGPWQPVIGWEPFGANFWFDWSGSGTLFISGENGLYRTDPANRKLTAGNTYYLKMRVESAGSGGGVYSAKMWTAGQTEPTGWQMTGQEGSGDLPGGSLLLIAHHVDATFGNITVTPLGGSGADTTPPTIANAQAIVADTTATINWSTDEPTTGAVTYSHGYRDEFAGTAPDSSVWTFVNPQGDGTVAVSGDKLALSVPAGTEHDLWSGVYTVPRLMRLTANQDFDLSAKFDSAVTQRYQMQGLVIEQDANNLVRCEIHHDGTARKVFAASIKSGTATTRLAKTVSGTGPLYLRVKRVGSQFTIYHSLNGTSWTNDKTFSLPLNVKATGLYVGNANGPAHTALVDWVSGAATSDVDAGPLGTQHSVTLTGLTPATAYPFWISASDAAGNSTVSPEYLFTTLAAAPANYSLTTSVSGNGSITRSPDQNAYSAGTVVQLTATAAAGYTFSGWSGDLTGTANPASITMNADRSVTATFTQLGDATPPVISNLQVTPAATSAAVSWTTNEPATGSVTYNFALAEPFDGSALAPDWTYADPRGDSTLSVSGGKLYLSVPAGTEHDLWTGIDTVPRVTRPVPNKDLDLQAKFDSAVSQGYQQQGIMIVQDSGRLIRVEVFHDGSSTRLFAATFASGTATARINKVITAGAPIHLRVQRTGSQWTVSYSYNGTNWTTGGTFSHTLTVAKAGVYAGNSSAAHTAVIDQLAGTWTADTTTAGANTQQNIGLANLIPSALYRYRVSATDTAGNTATSAESTFATTPAGSP